MWRARLPNQERVFELGISIKQNRVGDKDRRAHQNYLQCWVKNNSNWSIASTLIRNIFVRVGTQREVSKNAAFHQRKRPYVHQLLQVLSSQKGNSSRNALITSPRVPKSAFWIRSAQFRGRNHKIIRARSFNKLVILVGSEWRSPWLPKTKRNWKYSRKDQRGCSLTIQKDLSVSFLSKDNWLICFLLDFHRKWRRTLQWCVWRSERG